jgi:hypothetical protein
MGAHCSKKPIRVSTPLDAITSYDVKPETQASRFGISRFVRGPEFYTLGEMESARTFPEHLGKHNTLFSFINHPSRFTMTSIGIVTEAGCRKSLIEHYKAIGILSEAG